MSLRPSLLRLGLALLLAAAGAGRARAADDTRFSATLTAEQRAAAGLVRLTPDNLAVVDGLVRQDLAASRYQHNAVDGTRFTQRRTTRERELSGLAQLTPAEQAQLDELVGQRIADANPVGVVPAVATAAAAAVRTVKYVAPPEIHGSVSLTVGGGRGGSFVGGGVELTYDDPEHRYSVAVAYSVFRGRGLPWCVGPAGEPLAPLPGPY